MKRSWLGVLIAANLLALLALAFIYPQLMVSPGPLTPGHAKLNADCFACHAPWRGAASALCTECHATADIGLRDTQGRPLPARGLKTSFHQDLTEQNCIACHSDHPDPRLTRRDRKRFSHELLRSAVQQRCETCHAAPDNALHRPLRISCAQCHRTAGWKPAQFDHAALSQDLLARCEACHQPPRDKLHRQMTSRCGACHTTKAWKPATFDHAKYFVLDADHDADCTTCHTGGDFNRYSCYGCHEHQPARIRDKHIEEGIDSFDNCVKCHRSAEGEPGED